MFLTSVLACDERDLHVTTGFEDWCAQQGVHPEAFGAWESFAAVSTHAPPRSAG